MEKSVSKTKPRIIQFSEGETIILKTGTSELKINERMADAIRMFICSAGEPVEDLIDTLTTAMFDLMEFKIKQSEGVEGEFYLSPGLITEIRNLIDYHRVVSGKEPLV